MRFFYSLHTIPCVGFEAFYNGQSMVYSADTRFDPEMVLGLGKAGKVGVACMLPGLEKLTLSISDWYGASKAACELQL